MTDINIKKENHFQKIFFKKFLKKKFNLKFQKILRQIKSNIELEEVLNVLSSKYKFSFDKKDLKKFKIFKKIVIIGMGGSILGSQAIYNFLNTKIKKKIYFFDDIDERKILNFKKENNLKKTLFIIISKSGNTIETLSNFISMGVIKRDAKNIIIISEKKNNVLFSLSKKLNLFHIEHKHYIGGRYSVLSEVGIVPAIMMGLNILNLRKNIRVFLKKNELNFLRSSTLILANILFQKKINNLILLNYSPELERFLFWVQQLISESLGKNGKGFLPVISNVPKDHHSLLQLYLDGPKDKIFHIFSLEKNSQIKIFTKKIDQKISFLNNQKLHSIKIAQKNALIKSFKKNNIPFREFKIKRVNEQTLGELFSYFMLETIIVGELLNINPYNQPAVEDVKINTKQILS